MIKTGTATLYIQGSSGNSYTGLTTILGGDVYLNKTSGYAIPGDLTLGGNTQIFVSVQQSNQIASTSKWTWCGTGAWQEVKLFGHSQTVAGLCDATGQGVVENTWGESSYGALTFTINNSTDCSFNGTLRDTWSGSNVGAVSIIKTGTGSQTLAGSNIVYTGSTTISQGTLVLQDITDASLSARSVGNSGTLGLSAVNSTCSFSGVISGTGSLKVIGGNWVTLGGSNANTYTGTTTITDGKLILAKTAGVNAIPGDFTIVNDPGYVVVQNPNQFPATANVTFAGTGNPHFEVYGNTVTVGGISTSGGAKIENTEGETGVANGTLVVNNSANCSFSGTIRDNAGGSGKIAIVKNGGGILTLVGGDVGDYTGGLTVNAGTLDYSGGALPNCNYTITGGVLNVGSLTKSIGTFQITGGTLTGSGSAQLTSNAAYDVETGTVGIGLAGNVGLNKTTAGTAILIGANTYTGATTISGGTLQLGNGGSPGSLSSSTSIVVNSGGTLDVNRSGSVSFTNQLSGNGTLVKDGAGTLTMTGNSFSGNLLVNTGALTYSGASALPVGAYTVNGGTLSLGAGSQTIGAFQITGGTVTGTGALTSSSAYDIRGGTVTAVLAGNVGLNKTTSGAATLNSPTYTGTTSLSAGALTFNGAAARRQLCNLWRQPQRRLALTSDRHVPAYRRHRQRQRNAHEQCQLQRPERHDQQRSRRRSYDRLKQDGRWNRDAHQHEYLYGADHDFRRHAAIRRRPAPGARRRGGQYRHRRRRHSQYLPLQRRRLREPTERQRHVVHVRLRNGNDDRRQLVLGQHWHYSRRARLQRQLDSTCRQLHHHRRRVEHRLAFPVDRRLPGWQRHGDGYGHVDE